LRWLPRGSALRGCAGEGAPLCEWPRSAQERAPVAVQTLYTDAKKDAVTKHSYSSDCAHACTNTDARHATQVHGSRPTAAPGSHLPLQELAAPDIAVLEEGRARRRGGLRPARGPPGPLVRARPAAAPLERAALLLVLPLDVLLLLDHLAPRALLLKAVGRVPPVLRVVQRVGGLWHAREAARAEKRRPELVRNPTRNSAGKMIAPKSVTIGDVDTSSPHRGPLALPPCLRVSVVQNVRGTFVFVFP